MVVEGFKVRFEAGEALLSESAFKELGTWSFEYIG